ncbi:hypothetical protein QL285_089942 [Trifolium repens]|nr:hypothetical protein QL285_089942 [Trifolium repens]
MKTVRESSIKENQSHTASTTAPDPTPPPHHHFNTSPPAAQTTTTAPSNLTTTLHQITPPRHQDHIKTPALHQNPQTHR